MINKYLLPVEFGDCLNFVRRRFIFFKFTEWPIGVNVFNNFTRTKLKNVYITGLGDTSDFEKCLRNDVSWRDAVTFEEFQKLAETETILGAPKKRNMNMY